jgi:hypothetical protein
MTPIRFFLPAACLAICAGCVSYSPSQLSAMDTVDLCELREVQGPNLLPETKGAMQSELSRRGESCAKYVAEVAERRAEFLYREMYGRQDNP